MKNLRSKLIAIAAVSLFAVAATSCNEAVTPDVAGNSSTSVTEADTNSDSAAEDSDSAEDIGKPPKMDDNGGSSDDSIASQKKVSDGPTVSLPDIEASAGEEVTFKINVTDNEGLTALVALVELEDDCLEYVSFTGGDADDEENEDSPMYSNVSLNPYANEDADGTTNLYCMYFDGNQDTLAGDFTFATVTVKVKDDAAAGKHDLKFDTNTEGDTCNDYDRENGVILIKTPTYKNGSITVK